MDAVLLSIPKVSRTIMTRIIGFLILLDMDIQKTFFAKSSPNVYIPRTGIVAVYPVFVSRWNHHPDGCALSRSFAAFPLSQNDSVFCVWSILSFFLRKQPTKSKNKNQQYTFYTNKKQWLQGVAMLEALPLWVWHPKTLVIHTFVFEESRNFSLESLIHMNW